MEIADCREQLRASNLDLHKLLRFFASTGIYISLHFINNEKFLQYFFSKGAGYSLKI